MGERVLKARRRLLGEEHPDTLSSMNSLAETFRALGNMAGAREMGERVLQLRSRLLGNAHPSTVDAMRSLGETLKQLGQPERALELLTQAFDLQAMGQSRSMH
jgi:tetratricopeptide (TPR) repeat protein